MNRKKMLKKLADGENPIDISLEKYEQLKHKLYGWWGIVNTNDISAENCPLCFLYQKYGKTACSDCPLEKVGEGCKHENSAWKKLYNLLNESTIYMYGYNKSEIHIAITTLMFALKKAREHEQIKTEFLNWDEKWSESQYTVEEVKKEFHSVTYTRDYLYFMNIHSGVLYRIAIKNK